MKMARTVNAEVYVGDFDNFEQMVKKFSKKVKKASVIETYLEHRFYKSKSQKRREDVKRAKRAIELAKNNDGQALKNENNW